MFKKTLIVLAAAAIGFNVLAAPSPARADIQPADPSEIQQGQDLVGHYVTIQTGNGDIWEGEVVAEGPSVIELHVFSLNANYVFNFATVFYSITDHGPIVNRN